MEKSTKVSDGANVCYITVNFNYPIHKETDMPIYSVSNERTNKNMVIRTQQKTDQPYSRTFPPDNTASPSFLRTTDLEQQFRHHENDPNYFQMTKQKKGKVFIISNGFTGTDSERKGTKADERSLQQTFESLRGVNAEVEVTTVFDLTAREIVQYLGLFADSDALPSFYAVVIMSHGRGEDDREDGRLNDMIVGHDETVVNVQEVIRIFDKENLKDVPILMFFQMCRGVKQGAARFRSVEAVDSFRPNKVNGDDKNVVTENNEDGDDEVESAIKESQRQLLRTVLPGARFIGSKCEDGNEQIDAAPARHSVYDPRTCSSSGNDETTDLPSSLHAEGTQNMMLSFSTTEGCVSIRDIKKGSWFIQVLCKEIQKNAGSKDLVAIIDGVHHVIYEKRADTRALERCVISCDSAHTFHDKKLFFFPGLPK